MRRLIGWLAMALLVPAALAVAGETAPRGAWQADIELSYETLAATAAADGRFAVSVALDGDNLALAHDAAAGRLHILYRMNFNQVAEGWSWQPQADPAHSDYYRYKFLPLGSRERPQGMPYVQEDMPGQPRQVQRIWHYDYFLAFDNPYDFFARPTIEDDAGFAAEIALAEPQARELLAPGRFGMLAWARWVEPKQAESTTFWKATDGKPVDLTLKNRYLIAKLEEVWFFDTLDGRVLAKLAPVRR